jgi:hypothetical protein
MQTLNQRRGSFHLPHHDEQRPIQVARQSSQKSRSRRTQKAQRRSALLTLLQVCDQRAISRQPLK